MAADARSSVDAPFDTVDISSGLRKATNQPNVVSKIAFIVIPENRPINQPCICVLGVHGVLPLY